MSTENQPDNAGNKTIDYRTLTAMAKRRWWWFAISIALFIGMAIVWKVRHVDTYEVYSNIMVRPEKSSMGNLASAFDIATNSLQSQEVDDELALLSSYTVMNSVVRKLKYNCSYIIKENLLRKVPCPDSAPLELFYDTTLPDTLSRTLIFKVDVNENGKANVLIKEMLKGKTVYKEKGLTLPATLKTSWGTYVLQKTKFFEPGEEFKEHIFLSSYRRATEKLMEDVSTSIPSKRANVIRLGLISKTPGYGEFLLNTIVDQYCQDEVRRKQDQQNRTIHFIDERLKTLTEELSLSESDIEQFKRSHKLADLGSDISYTMGRRGQLESRLMNAETRLELLNMARTFLNTPENKYSLIPSMGAGDDGVNIPGLSAYNNLILKRMELTNNAKGNNAILRNLDEQLDAMRTNILESIERSCSSQKLVVENLRSESNTTSSRLEGTPALERQYITIRRQQQVQEKIFLYLLQLREETELNIAKAEPRSEVIDRAYTISQPVGMTFPKLIFVLFVMSIAFPAGLIFLLYRFRTKFSSRRELEKLTQVPILGELCTDESGRTLVVNEKGSTTAELMRLMRTNLQYVLGNSKDRVVLVTSSRSGEGKSFVSVNLAASLAMLGKKVILVGMDIRKPRLAQYLNLNPRFGLTEYITTDRLSEDDLINNYNRDGVTLDVITAGPIPPNPAELLTNPKVEALIKRLAAEYDYVIIDSAPVGLVSDTFNIAPYANASIYVVRADYTHTDDIQFLNSVYDEQRLPSLSIALNGVKKSSQAGYGYGYGHQNTK